MNEALVQPIEDEVKDTGRNIWGKTRYEGVVVDSDPSKDYKKGSEGDDTSPTVVPLVLEYGIGLPGKQHPYGEIKDGQIFTEKNGECIAIGVSSPSTRAMEVKSAGVVLTGTVPGSNARLPVKAPSGRKRKVFLEEVANEQPVVMWTLSGEFGVFSGQAVNIVVSADNLWLGLITDTRNQTVYIPPADKDIEFSLGYNGQTKKVRYTGILLPLPENKQVLVYFIQE